MSSANGWSLRRNLQLLRFRLGQIHFCFGFAGHLYLHMVWSNEVSRLNLQIFSLSMLKNSSCHFAFFCYFQRPFRRNRQKENGLKNFAFV
jgi:hypothetical protein